MVKTNIAHCVLLRYYTMITVVQTHWCSSVLYLLSIRIQNDELKFEYYNMFYLKYGCGHFPRDTCMCTIRVQSYIWYSVERSFINCNKCMPPQLSKKKGCIQISHIFLDVSNRVFMIFTYKNEMENSNFFLFAC